MLLYRLVYRHPVDEYETKVTAYMNRKYAKRFGDTLTLVNIDFGGAMIPCDTYTFRSEKYPDKPINLSVFPRTREYRTNYMEVHYFESIYKKFKKQARTIFGKCSVLADRSKIGHHSDKEDYRWTLDTYMKKSGMSFVIWISEDSPFAVEYMMDLGMRKLYEKCEKMGLAVPGIYLNITKKLLEDDIIDMHDIPADCYDNEIAWKWYSFKDGFEAGDFCKL